MIQYEFICFFLISSAQQGFLRFYTIIGSLILLLLGCLSCFWFLAIRIKDSMNILARDLFGTLFSALKIWPLSLDLHRFDYDVHTLLCFTFYMASGLLMSLVVWVDFSSLLEYSWPLFLQLYYSAPFSLFYLTGTSSTQQII